MKNAKRALSLGLAIVLTLLLASPTRAFADSATIPPIDRNQETQLTLQYQYNGDPLSDVTFDLYLVGTVSNAGAFTITAPFNEQGVYEEDDPWDAVAEKMAQKAEADSNVKPIRSAKTNVEGQVVFKSETGSKLATGLYLVVGEPTTYEDDDCITAPFLISLPTYEDDQWNYDSVKAAPKASVVTNYTVIYHDNAESIDGVKAVHMPATEHFFITSERIIELYEPMLYAAGRKSGGQPRSGDNDSEKTSYYNLSYTVPQAEGYTFLGWTSEPQPLATGDEIGYQTVAFLPKTKVYDVHALWKQVSNTTHNPDNPDIPHNPDNPGGNDKPNSGSGSGTSTVSDDPAKKDPILPQTGVLWWPVAVLGTLGLAVFVISGTRGKQSSDRRGASPKGAMMTIGIVLVSSSVCLVLYNTWDDWRAGETMAEERVSVIQYLPHPDEKRKPSVWDMATAADNITEMPTQTIQGADFVGMLRISSLSLELPVRNEWSYPGLRRSPCRYAGSAYTDDLVICGHNYTQHFGRLKQLAKGDEVLLVAMNGDVFHYQVEEVTALFPSQYQEMTDSPYDLTLFTCTVGGRQRVTVRCSLTDLQSHSPNLIGSEYVFF